VLRALGIYGGAQGIWVDKKRTADLTADKAGITVGVLHTGSSYADDLTEDGVVYHYPQTGRSPGRDAAEVRSTKSAGAYGIPLFVIAYPSPESDLRYVRLARVESWNDESKIFLLTFVDASAESDLFAAGAGEEVKDEESLFCLTCTDPPKKRISKARPGQARFKFRVLSRYGARCAVCGIAVLSVLDAAHIRPKEDRGSDDPRNGLVLCAVHHRAFDAGYFAVEPDTLAIHYKRNKVGAGELYIREPDLTGLARRPHKDALTWRWTRWRESSGNGS
jgi:hypothetical protein